jgi:hypothetical protein
LMIADLTSLNRKSENNPFLIGIIERSAILYYYRTLYFIYNSKLLDL